MMNFGKILDEWDRQNPGVLTPENFGKDEEKPKERNAEKRRRLLRQRPDAEIDLHGLNRDEAWDALNDFFQRGRSLGFKKVLVIHGKGNHNSKIPKNKKDPGSGIAPNAPGSEGILKETTRKFIERCPFAGESGNNSPSAGGSGATWVLLKD